MKQADLDYFLTQDVMNVIMAVADTFEDHEYHRDQDSCVWKCAPELADIGFGDRFFDLQYNISRKEWVARIDRCTMEEYRTLRRICEDHNVEWIDKGDRDIEANRYAI